MRDNYQVITSLDSQKEFLITEIKNATTLGCRRFTVLYVLTINVLNRFLSFQLLRNFVLYSNSNNSNSTINEEIETFSISKNITIYQ